MGTYSKKKTNRKINNRTAPKDAAEFSFPAPTPKGGGFQGQQCATKGHGGTD